MNGSSYAALLVIAVGITLSTVNEVQVNFIGLVAALVSTMTAVLHGALLKKVIMKRPEEHVFQLHYHTTITSMIIMIPYVFFMDSEIFIVSNIESFAKGFPGLLILISVVTQYMQTVFSTLALSQISVVSHQVANTLKRLIVIVVSLMYFKNAINFSNAFGICMALSGFLMYGITMINSDGSSSRRDLCSIRDIWSSRKEPNKDIAVFTVTNTNGGKDVENWGLARDNDEKN
jgi:solute carrier family 35 protein E1